MTSPEQNGSEPESKDNRERVSSAIRTQRAILSAEFYWFGSHSYMDSSNIHARLDGQPLPVLDEHSDSERRIRIEVDENGDCDVVMDEA